MTDTERKQKTTMDLKKMISDRLPGVANTQVSGGKGFYLRITMVAQVMAWNNYALLFGTDQSAKRISERGGFGEEELDAFYPEWRNHIHGPFHHQTKLTPEQVKEREEAINWYRGYEVKETPEQFYARRRYPELKDKFDEVAFKFSYDDMMQFIHDYMEATTTGTPSEPEGEKEWSALQIAIYACNAGNSEESINEVAGMIDRFYNHDNHDPFEPKTNIADDDDNFTYGK